jgi:Ca2+-binding EF-hand superfamily protein
MVNGINSSGYDVTSIWENLFNKIDQNGDGLISKDELTSFMAENN